MSDEPKRPTLTAIAGGKSEKSAPDEEQKLSPEQEKQQAEMVEALRQQQQMMMEQMVNILEQTEKVPRQVAINAVRQTFEETAHLAKGFYPKRFDVTDHKVLWGFFIANKLDKQQKIQFEAYKQLSEKNDVKDVMLAALLLALIESPFARATVRARGYELQFFERPYVAEEPNKLILV